MPRRCSRSRDVSPMNSAFNNPTNGNQSVSAAAAAAAAANSEKPEQRNAANARERARMRVLSRAFCRLKTTLPWVPADTKLSKLDTLRLATSYIAHLRGLLGQEDNSCVQPLNLSWPFSFAPGLPRSSEWTSNSNDGTAMLSTSGRHSVGGSSCSGSGRDDEDEDDEEEVMGPPSGLEATSVYYSHQHHHQHHHNHHPHHQ